MARDLLIGVDAGTSVIKSVAFTASGRQVGACARPNRYRTVEGVGAEQDMAGTWADAAATLRGLAEAVPDLAGRAAAIAVTAQGDGTWLVDADGEPAGPALIWLDARAAASRKTCAPRPRAAATSRARARASPPARWGRSSCGWSGTGRRSWPAPRPPSTSRTGSTSS